MSASFDVVTRCAQGDFSRLETLARNMNDVYWKMIEKELKVIGFLGSSPSTAATITQYNRFLLSLFQECLINVIRSRWQMQFGLLVATSIMKLNPGSNYDKDKGKNWDIIVKTCQMMKDVARHMLQLSLEMMNQLMLFDDVTSKIESHQQDKNHKNNVNLGSMLFEEYINKLKTFINDEIIGSCNDWKEDIATLMDSFNYSIMDKNAATEFKKMCEMANAIEEKNNDEELNKNRDIIMIQEHETSYQMSRNDILQLIEILPYLQAELYAMDRSIAIMCVKFEGFSNLLSATCGSRIKLKDAMEVAMHNYGGKRCKLLIDELVKQGFEYFDDVACEDEKQLTD